MKSRNNLFFIIIPGLLAIFNSLNPIDDFNYTHWLFNYEYQFVKRGLVGSILKILNIKPTIEVVYLFSYVILFFMFFLYIKYFWKAIKKYKSEKSMFLFFLLVIFHSGTLQHFHYDIGRFDQIGIIAIILLINWLPRVTIMIQVITILLSFIILILIHEALFIIAGPLIFVYWIYFINNKPQFSLLKISIFLFLSMLTFLVSKYGLMQVVTEDNYYLILSKNYGNAVDIDAVSVLYRNIKDNFAYAEKIGFSFGHHILMLIVVAPLIYLFSILFYKYYTIINNLIDKFKYLLLVFSALSTLMLYPIAVDRFRWISLAITNIFIIVTTLIREEKFKTVTVNIFNRYRIIIGITLFLSLLLGPLEVGLSFSNNPSFRFFTKLLGLNI